MSYPPASRPSRPGLAATGTFFASREELACIMNTLCWGSPQVSLLHNHNLATEQLMMKLDERHAGATPDHRAAQPPRYEASRWSRELAFVNTVIYWDGARANPRQAQFAAGETRVFTGIDWPALDATLTPAPLWERSPLSHV